MEKRLGEMLIKDQIITRADFDGAAQKQIQTGLSLGRILIDMGKASEWEVAATLGKQLRLDGHGLLQGHLHGDQLQLPGYGVWFASVE